MSKKSTAKHKASGGYRQAIRDGYVHNNEPAFKRERRAKGGWWRCLSDQRLLRTAGRQAMKADRALGICLPRGEYGL